MEKKYHNNRFINLGLVTIMGLLLISCFNSQDYITNIQNYRNEKDIWLSNDFESPFLKTHTAFKRLTYFEIDKNFKIEAEVERNSNNDSITVVTNLGETRVYHVFGTAEFNIGKESCNLLLLTEDHTNLFIPFADKTNGDSTYGAGRYIETTIPSGNSITLDFNMAFNPYCAYVEGYSCPLPPKTNVLKVAIEAGEKIYEP